MLQISSGKFYASTREDHLHVTTHRGVLYSNYGFMPRERIETIVGSLLPAESFGGLHPIVCEVTERLPKPGGQIFAGSIVSVGAASLIRDFSALVSFCMNITCDPDRDLVQRLTVAPSSALGIHGLPRDYIPRMFDPKLQYQRKDIDSLSPFVTDLIGLERKAYRAAIRSIHRYVTAMHRLVDDLDLAYALLVASIEALAQEFNSTLPLWEHYEEKKRKRIDNALIDAPDQIRERVRQAVLDNEHVAIKRRFVEFSNHYLQPSFFRNDMDGHPYPAGRSELTRGLKTAYDLRSIYIHALSPLPNNLRSPSIPADLVLAEGYPTLTFRGLARVARHIIQEFIRQAPKVSQEEYDYTADYPNVIRAQLAPEYWIDNPDNYSTDSARMTLGWFIKQRAAQIENPERKVSDMRRVLKKIEQLVPSLAKAEQKVSLLSLYMLYMPYLAEDEHAAAQLFFDPYRTLFDQPSIESLVVHFLCGAQTPDWTPKESDQLLMAYTEQRFHKKGLDFGPLIAAALLLWIAEQYRTYGDQPRARQLIACAVEEYPSLKTIREFERDLSEHDELPEIHCSRILLPHLNRSDETSSEGSAAPPSVANGSPEADCGSQLS